MKVKLRAPDRAAWLAARLEGIGASDAAAAVGLSPFKTPFQLWAEKTGKLTPMEETEAMKWGHRLQRVVADVFSEESGRRVHDPGEFTIYEHRTDPFLIATLDYIQTIPGRVIEYDPAKPWEEDPEPVSAAIGLLEVKTAGYQKKDEWTDTPPLHYMVQVQHQMMVTGLRLASIAALIGGQRFVWQDVPRDEEFIVRLQYKLQRFWSDHVLRDIPPEPVAEDNPLLGNVLSLKDPDLVPGPGELLDWDAQRLMAIEELKLAERKRDEAEAHLKHAIGSHAGIVLPNGVRYRWTSETRAAYTVGPTSRRVLRRSQ